MVEAVRFGVLGRLTVQVDGHDASPRGPLQRRLLAALVLHAGEVVHADRLADAMWPDGLPANHLAALQTHVFRLRQVIPPETIGSEPVGYRLTAPAEAIDAHRFEQGVYEAGRTRTGDPAAAAAHLEALLALWRGSPYEELADDELARLEATRLEELRTRAAEERAACLLDLGQHDHVVVDLEVLAAAHPLRERPQAQLMLALHRCGRRADALAVYERYRRALAEDLGIDPSAALRQLHDDIVTGALDERAPSPPPAAPDAGAGPPSADPASPAVASTPATAGASPAPAPLRPNALNEVVRYASSFVGRDDVAATVSELLERERLVTLVGPGGVGKTRLAAEVCAAAADRAGQALWFCELAAADRASVVLTVAAALGIDDREGTDHRRRIAEVLRVQGGLVVLDNCEHVIDEAAEVAEAILSGAPGARVLATSRERLAVDGEHLVLVAPLPRPDGADGPAVQLFVDRARAVRPGWEPDASELALVADVCRRLDGLPLAIELAAARIHALTLDEVAEGLQSRFRLLTGGRRTTARHRSLSAAVSWSYDLLDDEHRAMFDAVSAFQSPFTPAGAAAVADVPPATAMERLSTLVERSLLHRVGDRFGVLESIRQFGADRLAERGLIAEVRRRHACHHLEVVERSRAQLATADDHGVLEGLDAALGDLRVAQRWLAGHGTHDERLRFCAQLRDYGFYRMRPEVLGWAEDAARAAEAEGMVDGLVRAAWVAASLEAWKRGDVGRGVELVGRARASMPDGDDPEHAVLEGLGHHHLVMGRLEEAVGYHDAALRTERARTDELCRLESHGGRVLARGYAGDPATDGDVDELLGSLHEGSPRLGASWAWYAAGEVVLDRDPRLAQERLRRSVELADAVGASFLTVIAGASAASIEARLGDPERALRDYRWLLALGQRSGVHVLQWTMLRAVAELLVRLGDHATAAVVLGGVTHTGSGNEVFGADAQRLAAVRAAVEGALGEAEAAARIAEGAACDDDAAVALVLDAFGRLD